MMCSSYCRNPALLFSGKRTPIRKCINRTLSLRDWDLTTCCRPWDEVLGLAQSPFSASEEGQRLALWCSTFVRILSQNELLSWKMGTILPSVRQIRLDRLGRGFAGRQMRGCYHWRLISTNKHLLSSSILWQLKRKIQKTRLATYSLSTIWISQRPLQSFPPLLFSV